MKVPLVLMLSLPRKITRLSKFWEKKKKHFHNLQSPQFLVYKHMNLMRLLSSLD